MTDSDRSYYVRGNAYHADPTRNFDPVDDLRRALCAGAVLVRYAASRLVNHFRRDPVDAIVAAICFAGFLGLVGLIAQIGNPHDVGGPVR